MGRINISITNEKTIERLKRMSAKMEVSYAVIVAIATHKLEVLQNVVKPLGENLFQVQSETDPSKYYIVTLPDGSVGRGLRDTHRRRRLFPLGCATGLRKGRP